MRFDEKLSANAKLLYGEIKALCDQQGCCWASNYYLATLYRVHKETVSLWLRQLRERNLIRIVITPEAGNQRRIYLTDASSEPTPSCEKPPEAGGKTSGGLSDSSPPSCELIAPNGAPLLIEKYIDYNDRIHSDPLKDLLSSEVVGKDEETKGQKEGSLSPPWTRPIPPVAAAPLPPEKQQVPSFVKPSVKETEDYMLSQKELCPSALTARAQALRFINYYESNGWKVGRNAMQDWRAAANNWLLNAKTYDQTSQRPRSSNRLHSPGNGSIDYSIPL